MVSSHRVCRIFIVHELPFPIGGPDKQGLWARVCTVPVRSGQTSSVYLEPKVYFVAAVLLTAGNQERLVSRAPHWRLESFDKFTRGYPPSIDGGHGVILVLRLCSLHLSGCIPSDWCHSSYNLPLTLSHMWRICVVLFNFELYFFNFEYYRSLYNHNSGPFRPSFSLDCSPLVLSLTRD